MLQKVIELKVEVINLPTHQGPLTINLIPVILSMPMLSNRSRQLLNFFAMIRDVLGGGRMGNTSLMIRTGSRINSNNKL